MRDVLCSYHACENGYAINRVLERVSQLYEGQTRRDLSKLFQYYYVVSSYYVLCSWLSWGELTYIFLSKARLETIAVTDSPVPQHAAGSDLAYRLQSTLLWMHNLSLRMPMLRFR